MQTDDERARIRARQLAAEALADGDATGWFEKLYSEAEAGVTAVPWADGMPNPHLSEWLASGIAGAGSGSGSGSGSGRTALVVGCGMGYDAELLARHGCTVTAFDVAPTAVTAAKRANPGSPVTYLTADLLDLPSEWSRAFDLVVEIYTIQPLFGPARARAIAAVHEPVAPGGTLLVIARATDEEDPVRDPAQMPWPLTRGELLAAGGPLRAGLIEQFMDNEDPPRLRWRAQFHRD